MVSRLDDRSSLKKVVQWWFMNSTNPEWNTVIEVFDCIMEGKCYFDCVQPCVCVYFELRKVHAYLNAQGPENLSEIKTSVTPAVLPESTHDPKQQT